MKKRIIVQIPLQRSTLCLLKDLARDGSGIIVQEAIKIIEEFMADIDPFFVELRRRFERRARAGYVVRNRDDAARLKLGLPQDVVDMAESLASSFCCSVPSFLGLVVEVMALRKKPVKQLQLFTVKGEQIAG